MGAGNGTLAKNILDYLSVEYPQVYERTQYKIVEISPKLAELQRARLASHSCVRIVNKSIFDWDVREPAPCFFLALEVIDNFAHDVVRYDSVTLEPYQGITAIDSAGEFHELYEPVTDPLILRFLDYRRRAGHVPPAFDSFLTSSPLLRRLRNSLPFAPNMTLPEYVPTRLLTFLEKLRDNFPLHRLLLSDFSKLPDAVPGYNAPVVQTRYKETMVPCSTYMVQPGYFDIFFPTSFELLRDMYELLMSNPTLSASSTTTAGQEAEPTGYRPSPMTTAASSLRLNVDFFSSSPRGRRSPVDGVMSSSGLDVGQRMSTVMTHKEFLEKYADLERTTLRSGENPMLDFYQNVKFLF
ncbi:hypothetical protein BOTBODRAFT_478061 [Botryobasidium botryosum FD-172 SS1]|uniref:Protein arginine methyltransferase NDUFAF7 n=1 Tax=Botryobasidium botryosum (strain FD-172 SS1) TaxID=930990 RepID=A0A067MTH1_BOTB1|nr:hypothetical protein BOTBODRAFT_478061 [Botryobasidium botryosum FD-172 SS1]